MNKRRKYVIGGGISGLIFAYYNPDYAIISPDLGGRLVDHGGALRKVFYTHADGRTLRFLEDVGINYRKTTRMIRYLKEGKLTNQITEWDRTVVAAKKCGIDISLASGSEEAEDVLGDTTLSVDDYCIDSFEFDADDLLHALHPHGEPHSWIREMVVRITDELIITDRSSYGYDRLVSTIPAPDFWFVWYDEDAPDLDASPMTYVLADRVIEPLEEKDFSMVYIVDSHAYVRVSTDAKYGDGQRYLYEFPGEATAAQCLRELPEGTTAIRHWTDPMAVVRTDLNNVPPPGVLFVGRYANWDHRIKMGDVIEQALYDEDFRLMWNRQKRFTMNFYDMNHLDDPEYRSAATKEQIMLLYPEVGEILDAISYKHHRKKRPIDVEKVREEIIDSFKYILNVMILWGITPDVLFELFDRKSSIVEERYRKMMEDL